MTVMTRLIGRVRVKIPERNIGLSYKRTTDSIIGYVVTDCLDYRKSYMSFVFVLAENLVTWESKAANYCAFLNKSRI